MILKGLGQDNYGIWEYEGVEDIISEVPADYPDRRAMTLPVPSSDFPTISTSWIDAIGAAIKTYGQVETAKAQQDARKFAVPYGYSLSPRPLTYYGQPGSALPGAGAGSFLGVPLGTLLLLAAAGAAAWIILKR